MTYASTAAASAFEKTLQDLGLSDGDELGDAVEFGRRAALLAAANLLWRRHLGPLFDTKQVQLLLGGRTRQAVSDLVKRNRLLALPDESGRLQFPAFQFTSAGRPLVAMPAILQILASAEINPYTIASWFVTPQSFLKGETPAQWLQAGKDVDVVLEVARRSAARLEQ